MQTEQKVDTWHVYILRCADGTYYTGATNDVARRVAQHTQGTGARYTRGRGPVQLVFVEPATSRAAAQIREAEIKKMSRLEKNELVTTHHNTLTIH